MADRRQALHILRTKLHRPPLATDVVCRKALHARLDEGAAGRAGSGPVHRPSQES